MEKKLKMLLVDDEPLILVSLSQIFDFDYLVFTANNGREAMRVIEGHPDVAIVISDQRMPDLKGVDLLKAIKKISPHTIRILLTGYADLEAVLASVNVGEVFRYVRKPWVPDTLRTIVSLAAATYLLRAGKTPLASPAAESKPPVSISPAVPVAVSIAASAALVPPSKEAAAKVLSNLPSRPPEVFATGEIGTLLSSLDAVLASLEAGSHARSTRTQVTQSAKTSELPTSHAAAGEAIADFRHHVSSEETFFGKLQEIRQQVSEKFSKASSKASTGNSTFERLFCRDGKPRVLIVDDEVSTLSSLQESLHQHFDLIVCTSADAALNVLRHDAFIACMITDMRMPKTNGVELILQAEAFVPLMPKILITAFADIEDIVKLVNKGMLFRYIQKPWDNQRLSDLLFEAVAECRRRVEEGLLARDISLAAAKPPDPVASLPSNSQAQHQSLNSTIATLRQLNERLNKKSG